MRGGILPLDLDTQLGEEEGTLPPQQGGGGSITKVPNPLPIPGRNTRRGQWSSWCFAAAGSCLGGLIIKTPTSLEASLRSVSTPTRTMEGCKGRTPNPFGSRANFLNVPYNYPPPHRDRGGHPGWVGFGRTPLPSPLPPLQRRPAPPPAFQFIYDTLSGVDTPPEVPASDRSSPLFFGGASSPERPRSPAQAQAPSAAVVVVVFCSEFVIAE